MYVFRFIILYVLHFRNQVFAYNLHCKMKKCVFLSWKCKYIGSGKLFDSKIKFCIQNRKTLALFETKNVYKTSL